MSFIFPERPGYCKNAPKYFFSVSNLLSSAISRFIPSGFALVSNKARVCGNVSIETKNEFTFSFFCSLDLVEKRRVMASAAAVLSSSNDAFEISIPVKSVTIVWKFRRASSLPCAISA